ncbi:MAG: VOC family protein [bacterium]
MKLGYVILYVKDVAKVVSFYEAAFGLARRFVHESGQYAEIETRATWGQIVAYVRDLDGVLVEIASEMGS